MPEFIKSDQLAVQIAESQGLPVQQISRIIVDLQTDEPARIYVEMIGDTQLLEIDWTARLSGAQINYGPGEHK